jgi:hypothetical protein
LSDQFDRDEAAVAAAAPPVEQLRTTWAGVIDSFSSHHAVWVVSLEAFAQVEHLPDVRRQLSDVYEERRAGLADLARAADPTLDDDAVRAFGAFHLALLGGLALQWLVDPERAPLSDDLVTGLRTTMDIVGEPKAERNGEREEAR